LKYVLYVHKGENEHPQAIGGGQLKHYISQIRGARHDIAEKLLS
jgi:hypothetical protein